MNSVGRRRIRGGRSSGRVAAAVESRGIHADVEVDVVPLDWRGERDAEIGSVGGRGRDQLHDALVRRHFGDFAPIAVAELGLLQLHAVPVRVDVALAVLAGLLDEDVLVRRHRAHEALEHADVAALRERVHQVVLVPLTQALVLALCERFPVNTCEWL